MARALAVARAGLEANVLALFQHRDFGAVLRELPRDCQAHHACVLIRQGLTRP